METASCNCIVCAQEFDTNELQSIALSKLNITSFKICQACLNLCDPEDDYLQARQIIEGYLKFADNRATSLFTEVSDLLDERTIKAG